MSYSAKKKLSGFIILLFLIQGVIIGSGIYFSPKVKLASKTESATQSPSFIQNPTTLTPPDTTQTEMRASYFNWEADFSKSDDSLVKEMGVKEIGDPLKYVVKRGDTLSRIWEKLGGRVDQAHMAAAAFKHEGISLASLRAGEELVLHLTQHGDIAQVRKELPEGKILSLELNESKYDSHIINPKIITTQRAVSGTIDHSLATSSLKEGVPYETIDEFIDLFSGRVEFSRDTQPGDTFSIIYDERNSADGRILTAGKIHAASFMNKGELMVAIRHEDKKGQAHYYDSKGEPIGNHFLRYPVKYTRVSSMFTKARFHPVLKRWRPHNGVDFAAPRGTPVRSVADGVVQRSGYSGGNGNMVKIKHDSKYASAYLHLNKITKGLRVGTRVTRGQVIGTVGSTGLATGPHLHYSFYVNGKYVDPMKIKLPRVPNKFDPIPEKLLKATLRKLKKQHKRVQLAALNNSEVRSNGNV